MTAEKMKLIAQYWPLARGNWRALYTKTARDIVVKLDFKNHKENTPYLYVKVSYSDVND